MLKIHAVSEAKDLFLWLCEIIEKEIGMSQ